MPPYHQVVPLGWLRAKQNTEQTEEQVLFVQDVETLETPVRGRQGHKTRPLRRAARRLLGKQLPPAPAGPLWAHTQGTEGRA